MSTLVVLLERPEFNSLHPHGSSQWSIVPVPRASTTFLASKGTWHTSGTQTYTQMSTQRVNNTLCYYGMIS